VSGPTLRVVTYNIRSLRDDTTAVVRVLRRLEPDVVCLQEAPRFGRWRAKVAALARRSGLFYVGGGPSTGATVVLSGLRAFVVDIVERRFTSTPGLHRRGAVLARLNVDGTHVAVTSVHLGLNAEERARHLVELRALQRLHPDVPHIVAGDLNETPDKAVWKELCSTFTDAWTVAPTGEELTFSVSQPRYRIDGVFVTPEIEILSCGVPDDVDSLTDYVRATDHRAVLATLRLPEWHASPAPAPEQVARGTSRYP
jgi:endonuclease/exonuclease/phosphatase family metal-dependent hydrolase